ncbi:B12-binding domain-containing radical SAM protein [Kitasatospora brasiliensis]|uniref:B12-binding domain-containing radical SAM protein n=1 Tax=Kitasatospora brasiliensis TaxID=3058040 RepID=UPI00292F3A1A|nr:radical SAM protein [Kitasatospora sp. K002]
MTPLAVERLREALRLAVPGFPDTAADESDLLLTDPPALRAHLEDHLADGSGRVRVTGTLDRRLILIERLDGRWVVADLSGEPHSTRAWPTRLDGHLSLDDAGSWLTLATLDDAAAQYFTRPTVTITALYHPETFPLPRFPLGISDLARAARSTLLGEVRLLDMQLGVTMGDLIKDIGSTPPDILGISATFGQHDLLTELLDAAFRLPNPPLVIAGGSLTVRNEALLLQQYPNLLIARGAGESTMQDLLAHWHGELDREQIQGIGFTGAARGGGLQLARRRTPTTPNRAQTDILPELDLLAATFQHDGVAQLECSRGCISACSFCPRGHKGQWSGGEPSALPWLLGEMSDVFNRFPHLSRTIYSVDEEFIGGAPDAVPRALDLAHTFHDAGFRWETSCRIEQVCNPRHDARWHTERADMWRKLVELGLRRCLFGVESGVDSILTRFNKDTTAEQNALAIRTLSALGVPSRLTYITFDPLMSADELGQSHTFQGRTDLLLKPLPHLPVEAIVEGVRDPGFVAEHATGRPLHSGISYMLVSMECLVGAAYTRKAEQAGLTGAARPSMGRVDSRYLDPRIGAASTAAQLWIDRSFPLDYTLKSLEKVLDGEPRHAVRSARTVLKDSAYTVLGGMLREITATTAPGDTSGLARRIASLLDREFDQLRDTVGAGIGALTATLSARHADRLTEQYDRWNASTGWELINAADPCGT